MSFNGFDNKDIYLVNGKQIPSSVILKHLAIYYWMYNWKLCGTLLNGTKIIKIKVKKKYKGHHMALGYNIRTKMFFDGELPKIDNGSDIDELPKIDNGSDIDDDNKEEKKEDKK